ncbi:hypothetical protein QLX08_005177 [Tetragonisca angustula]|uniref:Uncharacterized protein n=1 Tax=Tetragonisca angustula TaxID=166442 RepID=A0AAW0ZZE9_9HYME
MDEGVAESDTNITPILGRVDNYVGWTKATGVYAAIPHARAWTMALYAADAARIRNRVGPPLGTCVGKHPHVSAHATRKETRTFPPTHLEEV